MNLNFTTFWIWKVKGTIIKQHRLHERYFEYKYSSMRFPVFTIDWLYGYSFSLPPSPTLQKTLTCTLWSSRNFQLLSQIYANTKNTESTLKKRIHNESIIKPLMLYWYIGKSNRSKHLLFFFFFNYAVRYGFRPIVCGVIKRRRRAAGHGVRWSHCRLRFV